MSSTTSSLSASSTSAAASPTSTDATYDFSIKEATIRNTAIGVCLALFVFLICALVGLEIMRRRMKRMRKQLLKYMRQEEEGYSTQYLSPDTRIKMERTGSTPASSDSGRYQLVSPVARAPERSVTEISGQGELYESDARSVNSFHRGDTRKHNKNVSSKWYDLRAYTHRES
ncbi:hypothetical protein CKM354_000247600 [Cercospora kikuchii]|uniref:Uncharacterized protein n=1 Tax=Cercospora kikuchii TaxID=84275 RepID=A0A9P3CFP9_9PEZI|nr:uncharacterized protein CKM354_000247600 [Cercospora kikuchii]GIZ39085.1 hypothetical protein CKM354_000247600 [Cercospora kikuchii]